MPRYNRITERMFATIADDNTVRGTYKAFLAVDKNHNLPESESLKTLKEAYSSVIQNCIEDIKTLAMLEEIIIQTRCKEVIDKEIRLSLSRNYIYARSLFFRKDKEINDIRVMVGKTDDWGEDMESLIKDPKFLAIAKTMLLESMDKEIQNNINHLNQIYQCQEK